MNEVVLRGIRARGHHGASPGEPDRPQEFVVDLEVSVDPRSDELASTADYRELARAAVAAVEGDPVVLLETLARRVAGAVAAVDHVVRVRATVHKPRAAASVGAEDVSASAAEPPEPPRP